MVPLDSGWNMVSIPLVLSNTSSNNVLQTVNDTCEAAFYYDASHSLDPWKDTISGDLSHINNTMALWLHLNATDFMITAGSVPDSTDMNLYTGWNFVGYPSYTNRYLGNALGEINWKTVEFYDSGDADDHWKVNNTAKPSNMNDLRELKTGEGYWVFVTEDCVWTVYE